MHGLEPRQENLWRRFYEIFELDKQKEAKYIFTLFFVNQLLKEVNSHRFKNVWDQSGLLYGFPCLKLEC